MKRLLLGMPGL